MKLRSQNLILTPWCALCLVSVSSLIPATAQQDGERLREIPADLISDRDLRSELGVNNFTAPSINQLFNQLEQLGHINYGEISRELPERIPSDRSQVSLSLGLLIADGFAAVQGDQFDQIETIGRHILAHAEALGTGDRVRSHSRNLIQRAASGSRQELQQALASTQEDVETEMVELRDVDLAHLISLGGWLRGFQIGCDMVASPFDPERMELLARTDIIRYYSEELSYIQDHFPESSALSEVSAGLNELERLLDQPKSRPFTSRDLERITALADALVRTIEQD